jgi:hypothetical protein
LFIQSVRVCAQGNLTRQGFVLQTTVDYDRVSSFGCGDETQKGGIGIAQILWTLGYGMTVMITPSLTNTDLQFHTCHFNEVSGGLRTRSRSENPATIAKTIMGFLYSKS